MDFKNKLKNFWRLNAQSAKGFTLVELIVVIAILAILAGIAVPAYSGYVEKANKQADETLISEIESAITLAGYNNTFGEGEGGYIVLSTEGIVNDIEEGSALDNALTATFGDNYENVLKLKYDSWENNRLYFGLVDGGAESVYNSTYYDVSDELMGQVKDITDAALSILEISGSGNNRNDMIALFAQDGEAVGSSAFLDAVAGTYGYVDKDGNGDISLVSDAELPNLLVLAVAMDITSARYNDQYQISDTSKLISDFALYNGYAATAQGKSEGFDVAYSTFVSSLEAANGIEDVADAYRILKNTANAPTSSYATYVAGQGQMDVEAFESMMTGLTSATADSNASRTKGDLANNEFFTTGVGNALFGTYIDSVEAFAGIDFADTTIRDAFISDMAQEGVVGLFFTSFGTHIVINSSLPIN